MPRVNPKPQTRPSRRATTALEFALVLPVLITLVLGCVDFGRFAFTYIVVTNGARTGASFATMNPYTPETYSLWKDGIEQAIVEDMEGLNQFNPNALSVQTTVIAGSGQAWRVQVTVSYPFHTLIDWPGIPCSITLSQTVVMRTIRP